MNDLDILCVNIVGVSADSQRLVVFVQFFYRPQCFYYSFLTFIKCDDVVKKKKQADQLYDLFCARMIAWYVRF